MIWRCRDHIFDLGNRTLVMGILNVTPDSFSDGGRWLDPAAAIERGRQLLAEGADLLDVGAESTRPGAARVSSAEQLRRLVPVLDGLSGAPQSVDTASAEVAAEALARGAIAVNDVTALGEPAMAGVVARAGAGVVLMHMRGEPRTMQQDVHYDDVVAEVAAFLRERRALAGAAGIADEQIVLDPGIGFGKTVSQNLELIDRLAEIKALGYPVLVGPSRKSFIGYTLDLPPNQRLEGTAASVAVSVVRGADIVRVHDVEVMARVAKMTDAIARH